MYNGVMHTAAVAVIGNGAIPALFYFVRSPACQIPPLLAGHDIFKVVVCNIAEFVVIQTVEPVAGVYIPLGSDGDEMHLAVLAHCAIREAVL